MVREVRGLAPRTAQGKIRSPRVTQWAVERPRLVEALDAAFDDPSLPFIMVSAPAGYGKSYLLAQWAALQRDRGVLTAWCELTEDDRDPTVFWSTIIDSLARAAASVDREFVARLRSLEPATAPRDHAMFVAAMFDSFETHDGPICLIVDDSQRLERSPSEMEFVRLIQLVPDNVRLAFATRSALQSQTSRVSGRLVELTADSLSFTRVEAAELFALRGFVDSDIEQLYETAEGWPAALSLAALSVDRAPASGLVISDWSNPGELTAYLQSEVWNDLDDEERAVLLPFGVMPLATPELVDLLADVPCSAKGLRELAANNRMLRRVSTDDRERTWYRVQPLFSAFLRERIVESGPATLATMRRTAARWHADNGYTLTALRLALESQDTGLIDDILRAHGYQLVSDGHGEKLLDMMPSAPNRLMTGPFARLMMAYASACCGKADRATEFLANPRIDDLGVGDLLEWDWLHYLAELQIAVATGTPVSRTSSGWEEETLADVPDQLRLAIRLTRGLEAVRVGDETEANSDLNAALAAAENEEDLSNIVLGTVGLAGAAANACDFRTTLARADEALRRATESTTQNQNGSRAIAHSFASWASLELLDTAAAREHATAALELAEKQPEDVVRLQVQHAYNDAWFEVLDQKRRVAQEFVTAWPPPYLRGASHTSIVASLFSGLRMATHLNERRWSERLLNTGRQMLGERFDWQIAYCLYLISIGRHDSARTVLGPLMGEEHSGAVPLSEIVAWSMDAVLESRANNPYRAHSSIYRALERADETGAYYEVGRVGMRAVAQILAAGSGRFGPHEHVAKSLLAEDVGGGGALDSGELTYRERQILGELRTLRTVDEIAHDLLLSVNTVKTHMRGIYRKLGVSSRRQAIAKAERFGLL